MSDLVSIIVPAYNAGAFIRETISSALEQTHRNIEVVVVDDGSSDDTAAVVEGIRDPRLRLIRQANAGQGAASNRGVREARGDFIKFLDADDWLNPSHIEAQLNALSGASTRLASCRWGYFVDHRDSPRIRPEVTNRDYDNPVDWIVDSLACDEGMMGGWMWLIPRDVIQRTGGWDERLTLNNDFDFSIRLLLASTGVSFAHDAVYSYREGVRSAVSGGRDRKAMASAFLTTQCGCAALLERETSERTMRVCADRWQRWIYSFYPEFPDLAEQAEREVAALGGSSLPIEGGRALRVMVPVLGWKTVRRIQAFIYGFGWRRVLEWKSKRRLDSINREAR